MPDRDRPARHIQKKQNVYEKPMEILVLNGGETDYLTDFPKHHISSEILRRLQIDFYNQNFYTDHEETPCHEILEEWFTCLVTHAYILSHRSRSAYHQHAKQLNKILK